MSTNSLVERILAADDDDVPASVADAVHELSDESSIDASAAPRSVAEAAALVGLSPTHSAITSRSAWSAPRATGRGTANTRKLTYGGSCS